MEPASIREYGAREGQRGQVLPIFALSLVLLCGVAALAVDVGYWRLQQRVEQTAADSAAIAGTNEISHTTTLTSSGALSAITAAATQDAKTNGYDTADPNVSVTVHWPPQAPSAAAYQTTNAVEVILSKKQPAFFGNIFGISQTVQVRAVAVLSSKGRGCIYVLKGSLQDGNVTLNGGGGGGVKTSPLCGLVVNGDLQVTNNFPVNVSYASYAGTFNGGGVYPGNVVPEHSQVVADPCSNIAGCNYLQNLSKTASPFTDSCRDTPAGLPAQPLPPGHYCYGPFATSPPGQPLALQAGLFIMDQGMFDSSWNVTGTDVTIYNNCTVPTKLNNNCDVTLGGSKAIINFTGPTPATCANDSPSTCPQDGMAYFQPASLKNNITIGGAASLTQVFGGIYAPGADITLNGSTPLLSTLVAGTITLNGQALNVSDGNSGDPQVTDAVLAE